MIYNGDCLGVLKGLPSGGVDCVMTSPPYRVLRCYLPDGVKMRDNLTPEEKEYIEVAGKRINIGSLWVDQEKS